MVNHKITNHIIRYCVEPQGTTECRVHDSTFRPKVNLEKNNYQSMVRKHIYK